MDTRNSARAWEKPVKIAALIVGAVIVGAIALWALSPSEGAPPSRGGWLHTFPGPNQEVKDPALVRRLREAAGASETVDVELTVFIADGGHAPAVSIQADDVLTYLGRRLGRISKELCCTSFLEISDGDGDEVLVRAVGRPQWAAELWLRRDLQGCFPGPTRSLGGGAELPPCPINRSASEDWPGWWALTPAPSGG